MLTARTDLTLKISDVVNHLHATRNVLKVLRPSMSA